MSLFISVLNSLKGRGGNFVTQNSPDILVDVLGQLGNRVQHAFRSFERLARKGKAGLVAKQGYAVYTRVNNEHFVPIYNAISFELRGFKTVSGKKAIAHIRFS